MINVRQSLIAINADIKLAEKEKKKILDDLEQLQKSLGEANKNYDKHLSLKREALDNVQKELSFVKELCQRYTSALELLKPELANFGKKEIAEAEDRLKVIHGDIEAVKRELIDRENNTKEEAKRVERESRSADSKLRVAESIRKANEQEEVRLNEKAAKISEDEAKAKEAVVKAQDLLDTINREIEKKRMQVQKLDITIEAKTKQADNIGAEAIAKLQEANRRMALATRKEEANNEKDKEFIQKEHWLDDREATVGRAYRETIQRGGKVEPPQIN